MKNKILPLVLSTALFIVFGCDISKRMQKVQQKALNKGVTIPRDTITIESTDTITEIVTSNDTTYITKTVTNTITLEPIVEYKTRWQTKIEYKEKIKYIKEETKQKKEETKQIKAENKRPNWWVFLIIGLVVGYMLNIFLRLRNIKI